MWVIIQCRSSIVLISLFLAHPAAGNVCVVVVSRSCSSCNVCWLRIVNTAVVRHYDLPHFAPCTASRSAATACWYRGECCCSTSVMWKLQLILFIYQSISFIAVCSTESDQIVFSLVNCSSLVSTSALKNHF